MRREIKWLEGEGNATIHRETKEDKMNWEEIKEKYPKASSHLEDWSADEEEFIINADSRCLYDFFDENGIHISIMHNHYYEDNMDNTLHEFFDWSVTVDSQYVADGDVEELTRTEAEEQAFLKAFEILENKLGAVK